MAIDKKISELPLASTLDGSEVLPLVQLGETRKVLISSLSDFIESGAWKLGGNDLLAPNHIGSTSGDYDIDFIRNGIQQIILQSGVVDFPVNTVSHGDHKYANHETVIRGYNDNVLIVPNYGIYCDNDGNTSISLGARQGYAQIATVNTLTLDYSNLLLTGGLWTVDSDATTALGIVTLQQLNNAVIGLYDDRGNFSAASNIFPASGGSGTAGAILKGDIWTISTGGTLGGTLVQLGDTVRAITDTPGQTAGNWVITNHGLGYTPVTNVLNSANILVGNSSNVATAVSLSLSATPGSFSLANTGALTMSDAATSTRGLLNATDWNIFNGKQNALTNPVTGTGVSGQVSFWNGTSSITGNAGFLFDSTKNIFSNTTTGKANGEQYYASSNENVLGISNTVIESQSGGTGVDFTHSSPFVCLKFTTSSSASFIQGITLKIKKSGTLTSTSSITVSLYVDNGSGTNPSGSAISSNSVFAGQTTTSYADFSFTFQNVNTPLTNSTIYWAVITFSESGGGSFVLNSQNGTGTSFQGSSIGSISETNIQLSNIIYARNYYGSHFVGNNSHGTWATSLTGVGLRGDSVSHYGVFGNSTTGDGARGASVWGNGVSGSSTNSFGGLFASTGGNGLKGTTSDNTGFAGVFAENTSGNLALFGNGKMRFIQSSLAVTSTFLQFTQSNHTSGVQTGLLYTAGVLTGQTTATEVIDINYNLSANLTMNDGTVALQRSFIIGGRTYLPTTTALTLTTAVTLDIAAPIAGAGTTITLGYAIRTNGSIRMTAGDIVMNSGSNIYASNGGFNIGTNSIARIAITTNGLITHTHTTASSGTQAMASWTQTANTGGSAGIISFVGAAHTGQTASTEVLDFNFGSNRTITWATGALALQRAMVIGGQTLAFAAASTVTIASTLDVQMPVAGTNASITNSYAQRWVFDASNYLGLNISSTGDATFTLTGSTKNFNISNFLVCSSSLSTNGTIGNANFFVIANGSQNSTTTSTLLFASATTVNARVWLNGNTTHTPAAGNSYSSFIIGTQAATIAGSGTHALFANMVINPVAINSGAATLTNSATLYVNGAATGATNNYGLWALGTTRFDGDVNYNDATNLVFGTSTGNKIGTSTSQKIGFWNKTPVVQPTTGITGAAFVTNSSGLVDGTATYGGYTGGQIVAALKLIGILA